MKTFWKVLGAAAVVVGLTPYKVEKNAETGESSYQALLYRLTSAPGQGEDKWDIGINLGEGTLTSKLLSAVEKEEPHLFSDELCVEYNGAPVTGEAVEKIAKEVDEAVEEVAREVDEAVEEAAEAAEPKAE